MWRGAHADSVQIPKFLRLNNVSLGDFLSKDGRQPVFTKNI